MSRILVLISESVLIPVILLSFNSSSTTFIIVLKLINSSNYIRQLLKFLSQIKSNLRSFRRRQYITYRIISQLVNIRLILLLLQHLPLHHIYRQFKTSIPITWRCISKPSRHIFRFLHMQLNRLQMWILLILVIIVSIML